MMCFPGSVLGILFGESRFYTGSTVELWPRVRRVFARWSEQQVGKRNMPTKRRVAFKAAGGRRQ